MSIIGRLLGAKGDVVLIKQMKDIWQTDFVPVITNVFYGVYRNFHILLYPIIFSWIVLGVGVYFVGWIGEPRLAVPIPLNIGFPLISDVYEPNYLGVDPETGAEAMINAPIFVNTLQFLIHEGLPWYIWMVVVYFIAFGAYMQAGFIGLLHHVAEGKRPSFVTFLKYAARFWGRMLMVVIFLKLVTIALSTFLAMFFDVVGVFMALATMVFLRIVFLYWEYAIVVDNLGIGAALKQSRRYSRNLKAQSLVVVLLMFVVGAVLGMVLHLTWSIGAVILMTVIYAYVMALVHLAIMKSLHQAKNAFDF